MNRFQCEAKKRECVYYMQKISVIVLIYNVESYLHQCIDSILAQTYTDFELILVDDGSTDHCGVICDEYAQKDDRVRVIHQEYLGVSAARNTGVDAVKGEYIVFVDSDDVVLDTYLETLLNVALAQQADISVCGMITFADGTTPNLNPCQDVSVEVMTGRDACLSIYRMDGKVPVMAWGKLYRTSLFDGIRYPVGRIHEDDATTPRVLYRAKRVALSSEQLYLYRQRAGSIMGATFSAKRFDIIPAIDGNLAFFNEMGEIEISEAIRVFKAKTYYLNILSAYRAGIQNQIPKAYKMPEWKAIIGLKRILPGYKWDWYMDQYHPSLVVMNSYLRKIESILGIKTPNEMRCLF